MKGILLVTDSEAMRGYEQALLAEVHAGFTIMPAVAGSGRHGLKTGDRVHPGGSSVMLTVVEDGSTDATLDALRRVRDAGGSADVTKIWTFPVDEVL